MTKLKTLKDMKTWDRDEEHGRAVREDELREEAIKWAKRTDDMVERSCVYPDDLIAVRNWIKHFFNITEKELK